MVEKTRTDRQGLIIGAGIAGPAVAMALRYVGIDALVFEATPEPRDEAGAFLNLAPNGINVALAASRWREMPVGAPLSATDKNVGSRFSSGIVMTQFHDQGFATRVSYPPESCASLTTAPELLS
jgi:flavin-dependent dehydrogenase